MSTELSQWKKENTSISQYLYKIEFLFLRYSCDPRLRGCTRRGHDDTDCSPTQVGCYSTHGGRGGGNRQILLWSHTWSMYKKRTWWHILRPHPGGMLLYPRGMGGGGINRYSCDPRLGVCTRRGHNDTYCGPTQVGCCYTHWRGGGLQEFPKSGPTLAFFVLIKGHTTIFFLFFSEGGGRDGGQLHLGIPSSKLDPCPWPINAVTLRNYQRVISPHDIDTLLHR